MATRTIDLKFSDDDYGCEEFGFIPRPEHVKGTAYWNEDEDAHYAAWLRRQKGVKARVVEGTIYLEES